MLRKAAIDEARKAPVQVEVVDGLASALPADDASQDAVVASLVLCSVSDQAEALAEMRRVLKPERELRFYEHVIARKPLPARLQRFADATFWPRVGGGCHMARDTQASIEKAGFEIERVERFTFTPGARCPQSPTFSGRHASDRRRLGQSVSSPSTRRRRTALVATMIELTDISSADHSGRSSIP